MRGGDNTPAPCRGLSGSEVETDENVETFHINRSY